MSSAALQKLREVMKNVGYKNAPIHALIITNHDEHMSEYLAEKDRRLKFVTGFSGSAGTAIITEAEANLWTDGRYFLQAAKEMGTNWTLMKAGLHGTPTEGAWLCKNLAKGSLVGTDPKLISYGVWNSLQEQLEASGIQLVPLSCNYVDEIWMDRPKLPATSIRVHELKFAGKCTTFKAETILNIMQEKSVDTLILSALDDIAWLLNLRGEDIKFNPVFFSFVMLRCDKIHLFIEKEKITDPIASYFTSENLPIIIYPYDTIYDVLKDMEPKINKVWICKGTNYQIYDLFPKHKRFSQISPVANLKAVKNNIETQGMINAHIKDGIALCRYFSYLESTIDKNTLTEISGAKTLEYFRREELDYIGPSFDTISSVGPNSAIIHYSPTEASNRLITNGQIYLCDSGGQYLDGTTDVTRTVHFGKPTDFQKACFTRVLKGSIALATVKFPFGTKGNLLDSLARKPLWELGLDYNHGTGHGIGSCLCVHEGPIGITNRHLPNDPGLEPNMFLSDEPGYYHEGEFGIRIENIVQVVPAEIGSRLTKDGKEFLTFQTITMCPIQLSLLNVSLLTDKEIAFINEYHNRVRESLAPILQRRHFVEAYEWLEKQTVPIKPC